MMPFAQRFVYYIKNNNIKQLIKLANGKFKDKFFKEKDENGNHVLHAIARQGTPADLEAILKIDKRALRLLNRPNRQGNTPLHEATHADRIEMIKALTQRGADVAKANLAGDTSLHIAAKQNHVAAANQLCKAGFIQNRQPPDLELPKILALKVFDLYAQNKKGLTVIDLAEKHDSDYLSRLLSVHEEKLDFHKALAFIYRGKPKSLKKHLKAYPGLLEEADDVDNNLLHHAVFAFKETGKSCIVTLLQAGCDVTFKNKEGHTPFLLAAALNVWMINAFKDRGVDLNEKDKDGYSAIHYAAHHDNEVAIRKLHEKGVYIDMVTSDGITPLHMAALNNRIIAFNVLLELKAKINSEAYPSAAMKMFNIQVEANQSITPLWLAMNAGHVEMINKLFDYNYSLPLRSPKRVAYKKITTLDGSNILHFFARNGDVERFKKSAAKNPRLFEKNKQQMTPLHAACAQGSLPIVRYIVEAGPKQAYWDQYQYGKFDINDKIADGSNAFKIAKKHNHKDLVRYLRQHGAVNPTQVDDGPGVTQRIGRFINEQAQFQEQLENNSYYKAANLFLISGRTALTLFTSVGAFGAQALHQTLMHVLPMVQRGATRGYYAIKPFVHNHAPVIAEEFLDFFATATSGAAYVSMKTLNTADWIANPGRRTAELITGLTLANAAAKLTNNQGIQAISYLAGREIGRITVDAYEQTKSGAKESVSQAELEKAYHIWRSILGQTKGDIFVDFMHSFMQMNFTLLENVGWLEQTLLSKLQGGANFIAGYIPESVVELQKTLQTGLSAIVPEQMQLLSPQSVYAHVLSVSRKVQDLRTQALKDIEHYIDYDLIRDSEYKDYLYGYLEMTKLALTQTELHEAEVKENNAKDALESAKNDREALGNGATAEDDAKIQAAELYVNERAEIVKQLQEKVEQAKESFKTAWCKTPVGAAEQDFDEASSGLLTTKIEHEKAKLDLEYLRNHQGDEQEFAEAQERVSQTEQVLNVAQNYFNEMEQKWDKVMTPVSRAAYLDKKPEIEKEEKELIEKYIKDTREMHDMFDGVVSLQGEAGESFTMLKTSELALNSINTQCYEYEKYVDALKNPGHFDPDKTVEAALQAYPKNPVKIAEYIIKAIVATGVINEPEAKRRMEDTFQKAAQPTDRTNEIRAVVNHHWNLLFDTEYKSSILKKNAQLHQQQAAILKTYQTNNENHKKINDKLDTAKEQFANKLSNEDKLQFLIDLELPGFCSRPFNWSIEYNSYEMRKVLILAGQPELAFMFANSPYEVFSNKLGKQFTAKDMASILIDYKYLFLTSPSLDVRMQEAQALAKTLKPADLTSKGFASEVAKINQTIAENLVTSVATQGVTGSIGAKVLLELQKGLQYQESGDAFELKYRDLPLQTFIDNALKENKQGEAIEAVKFVLQNQTQAISVKEVGTYEKPKAVSATSTVAPTSEPKRKKHGFKKILSEIGDAVKYVGKEVLRNGITTQIRGPHMYAGLTEDAMHKVFSFHKQPQVLFKIDNPITFKEKPKQKDKPSPQTPLRKIHVVPGISLKRTDEPFPSRVVKPMAKVIELPWEREDKAKQPLIFSKEAKRAAETTQRVTRAQEQKVEQTRRSTKATDLPELLSATKGRFPAEINLKPFTTIELFKEGSQLTNGDFYRMLLNKGIKIERKAAKKGFEWAKHAVKNIAGIQKKPPTVAEKSVRAIGEGFSIGFDKLTSFALDEVSKLKHGEETATGKIAKQIMEVDFQNITSEDILRVSKKAGEHLKNEFIGLLDKPYEELLRLAGEEAFYMLTGESILRVGGLAFSSIKPVLHEGIGLEFFKGYGIRPPITFSVAHGRLNAGIPWDLLQTQSLFYRRATEHFAYDHLASNVVNGNRLRVQLELQEKGVLDLSGRLTTEAIANSTEALGKKNNVIGFPPVVKELTKDGSRIENWRKLKTKPTLLSSGQEIEVHFYRNLKTNEVNYNIDFKVKELINPTPRKPLPNSSYHLKDKDDYKLISTVTGRKIR